jgi:hypothetical protein
MAGFEVSTEAPKASCLPARRVEILPSRLAHVQKSRHKRLTFALHPAQQKLLRQYTRECHLTIVREFLDVGNIKDWITVDELDLVVHFVKENAVVSKESRWSDKFLYGIKVLMAKNYVDNLSEEVKKGLRENAEEGHWPTVAPVAYINNRVTHRIEVDPVRGPLVARVFELHAAGNYSLKAITQTAYQLGLRHPRGRPADDEVGDSPHAATAGVHGRVHLDREAPCRLTRTADHPEDVCIHRRQALAVLPDRPTWIRSVVAAACAKGYRGEAQLVISRPVWTNGRQVSRPVYSGEDPALTVEVAWMNDGGPALRRRLSQRRGSTRPDHVADHGGLRSYSPRRW